MMILTLISALTLTAHAQKVTTPKWTEFKAPNGGNSLIARPIGVEGNKIKFLKKKGGFVTVKPSIFRENDKKNLLAWKTAMEDSAHQKLITKVQNTKTLRVLFVGNSYSFNVPKAFDTLAKKKGKTLQVEQVTHGGWTLGKHSQSPATLTKIKDGKFDIIVLQEQSLIPAFPEGQRNRMIEAPVKTLTKAIRDSGAIPVFYQTWGRKNGDKQNAKVFPNDTFAAMQKRLIAGYKHASKVGGGVHIVPVGEVWAKLKSDGKDHKLYTADGSHPAVNGTGLTAAAFFSAFYNEPFNGKIEQASDHAMLQPIPYPLPQK